MPNSEFFEEETNDEDNEQGTESDTNSRKEILCAILRSLMLVDQMNGSQRDILEAIEFAKGLYCHKDSNLSKLWPKNWKELEKLLKENGYEDPKELCVSISMILITPSGMYWIVLMQHVGFAGKKEPLNTAILAYLPK